MQFLVVIGFIIAAFAIIFALQNPAFIGINVFLWRLEAPLALLVLIVLALGVTIGLLVALPTFFKKQNQLSRHKNQLKNIQEILSEKDSRLTEQEKRIQYLESKVKQDMNGKGQ